MFSAQFFGGVDLTFVKDYAFVQITLQTFSNFSMVHHNEICNPKCILLVCMYSIEISIVIRNSIYTLTYCIVQHLLQHNTLQIEIVDAI